MSELRIAIGQIWKPNEEYAPRRCRVVLIEHDDSGKCRAALLNLESKRTTYISLHAMRLPGRKGWTLDE